MKIRRVSNTEKCPDVVSAIRETCGLSKNLDSEKGLVIAEAG
jgi:hypothetical protein